MNGLRVDDESGFINISSHPECDGCDGCDEPESAVTKISVFRWMNLGWWKGEADVGKESKRCQ